MHLPLSFRVVSLSADDLQHAVTLVEVRGPLLNQPQGQLRAPDAPPSELRVLLTPDQFAGLRIGQVFDLEPRPQGLAMAAAPPKAEAYAQYSERPQFAQRSQS